MLAQIVLQLIRALHRIAGAQTGGRGPLEPDGAETPGREDLGDVDIPQVLRDGGGQRGIRIDHDLVANHAEGYPAGAGPAPVSTLTSERPTAGLPMGLGGVRMGIERFKDRQDAGHRLAGALGAYARAPRVLVLALPRGGVTVAAEVARRLGAPLDVILVRKLGVPGHEELAMGAIASGGVRILSEDIIESLGILDRDIAVVAAAEEDELDRREQAYRGLRAAPEIADRTVILVDDGLATGSTMRAAAAAVRSQSPHLLVVAVPVAPAPTVAVLRREVDDVVCLLSPERFRSVGEWYEDFEQTTDEEVRHLLGTDAST